MKDLKNIEDLFKESFNEFEITPPDNVKASVDKAIQSRKKGMWWLPVLALLLATAPFAYYWMSNSTSQDEWKREDDHTITYRSDSSIDSGFTAKTDDLSEKNVPSVAQKSEELSASKARSGLTAKSEKTTLKPVTVSKQSNTKTMASKTSSTKQYAKKSDKTPKKQSLKTKRKKNSTPTGDERKNNPVDPTVTLADATTESVKHSSDKATEAVSPETENDSQASETTPSEKDSLTPKVTDSTTAASDSSSSVPKKKEKTSEKNWLTSIYVGPQFDRMKSIEKDTAALKLDPGFRFSAEINRSLFSGYGVSSGFGYSSTNEVYSRFSYQFDSTYLYTDSVPILDQNDSIVGYNYFNVYGIDTTKNSSSSSYRITSVAIPLYLTKQIAFNDKWGLFVQAGAVYRISKIVGDPSNPLTSAPVINKNSLMLSGRIHASYKWNSWMFSLGLNAGYYVKPPLEYEGIKTSRSYFTPEVGVHFNF